jgi:hypothetical protein
MAPEGSIKLSGKGGFHKLPLSKFGSCSELFWIAMIFYGLALSLSIIALIISEVIGLSQLMFYITVGGAFTCLFTGAMLLFVDVTTNH